MSYTTRIILSNPSYTPELFRKREASFNAETMDRKQWLKAQVINIEYGIFEYNRSISLLANEAAQLDGKSDAAAWMQSAGLLITAIDFKGAGIENGAEINKYSKLAGAALITASIVINIFEKKKDNKRLKELYDNVISLRADLKLLEQYRQRFQSELTKLNLIPIALIGTAIYLMNN
ncbi:hypothetical protein [Dyadobacter sp. LHD-138]|uniref:hypothetical protein n=1 Tax=Dyadobacter sp. LHD-138 TaxID=3071413 RepID=UPI0027E02681|nr:hypothetical protein [Dyadobacter sp. LHD-138]MDQ6482348.1 hypothetical protein [Dyadobacter sp. LHD-138]